MVAVQMGVCVQPCGSGIKWKKRENKGVSQREYECVDSVFAER